MEGWQKQSRKITLKEYGFQTGIHLLWSGSFCFKHKPIPASLSILPTKPVLPKTFLERTEPGSPKSPQWHEMVRLPPRLIKTQKQPSCKGGDLMLLSIFEHAKINARHAMSFTRLASGLSTCRQGPKRVLPHSYLGCCQGRQIELPVKYVGQPLAPPWLLTLFTSQALSSPR